MTASKLGISMAMAALLAGTAVGQAQNAPQATHAASNAAAAANASTAAAAPKTAAAASSATAAAAPTATSSADTQASDSGLSVEQLREARDQGYKPITRHHVTLYCKSEILVGSAFPIHTCYNADRLKILLQQEQAERMQLQQMHSGGLQGN